MGGSRAPGRGSARQPETPLTKTCGDIQTGGRRRGAAKFVLKKGSTGRFRFNLPAGKGETIAVTGLALLVIGGAVGAGIGPAGSETDLEEIR